MDHSVDLSIPDFEKVRRARVRADNCNILQTRCRLRRGILTERVVMEFERDNGVMHDSRYTVLTGGQGKNCAYRAREAGIRETIVSLLASRPPRRTMLKTSEWLETGAVRIQCISSPAFQVTTVDLPFPSLCFCLLHHGQA